ncbi:MAG TPA: C39 family peptidase, partial [Ktedonobacterales bacterium]|nr:C39 family peptidase [Ktedonobacterales bacterium]
GFAGAIDAIAKALGFKGNLIPLWAPPGAGGSAGAAGTSGGTTGHGRAAAAYARGTANHPGGLALVGEEGPELVHLPKGAAVLPAGPTAGFLSGWGVPGYAGGIGDFVGGLLAHLGDGAAALIQQGLSAAGVTTKALTGVLGDLGSGTLSELMKLATTAIAHLLKTVTSTQNGGGGPVSASSGSAPGLLPGFPLMNQLAQHDVNDTNDCVPTSMASAASFLLKRLVSPVGIKDDVYGSGYVGGQAPDRYKGEMGKLGVTLQDAYGSAQSLIATIISHLRAGQPVLGSIPSDWNVISQGGPTHEVAFAGYDAGKGLLTAMNPWRGFFQTASPAWWAPRLQYGTVNPLVKLANGGVLREAVAGLGLSSGRSYLMGEAGPEAVTPLSQVGNGGVNIEHLEVTVVAAAEDGQPYAAGMAFGNGFAAGFQQARTQRGL